MLENREGQRIPEATFRTRQGHAWVNVTTDEVFAGRTVVVFALPGAFTPTCSSSHVPRFDQLAREFKANGIDEIICLAVNDAFVLNQWGISQKANNITFLPDGNAEFTRGMGMAVDKEELGFGLRSWRYSMLVRDGVIDKMFIEPSEPGDPYHVSDADTMLSYVAPHAPRPLDVTMLSRDGCAFCARAKELLKNAEIDFEELLLNRDFTDRTLRAVANATSYPQVFVNGLLVGGTDDLEAWLSDKQAA